MSHPPQTGTATMLVVDDHDLVRLGLRTLAQAHAAEQGRDLVVLEARTLQEALSCYERVGADIGLVLLDLNLPDAHGLSGLSSFVQRFPDARVVVVSGNNDPAVMRDALTRGAQAYLPKSGDLQHVIAYVRSIGLLGLDGSVAPPVPAWSDTLEPATRASGPYARLSERQTEILEWILAGRSNKEIADMAHLSEGTVKNHVSALLLHFGVRSRAQLISSLR